MFILVALAVWTLMNVYVLARIHSVRGIRSRVSLRITAVAGVVLGSAWLVARILESRGLSAVALEWIGVEWMGFLLIAVAMFFIADLITGFGFLLRSRVNAARTTALIATVVLALVATLNAIRPPVVRDYEVWMKDLPPERDGMVVVAISDLHLGTLTGERWLGRRVAEVNALRPDLIALAGDVVEGDGPAEEELLRSLRRLRAPLGVWAVPGNHERHAGGETDELMRAAGIRWLRDQWGEAAPGLVIAGVDNPGHRPQPGRGDVSRALEGRPHPAAVILLSHIPAQVDTAAASGVGLMLAGHTHGGQIWPFGLFVRMAYPYSAGRYEAGPTTVIVCRGTGTWGPRMRLWAPNEILRIVLRSARPPLQSRVSTSPIRYIRYVHAKQSTPSTAPASESMK
ncbi:MAG: metallophosphoesterase [Thermoanaerobaculia bacterium]